jgi:hypothetical protein
MINYNREVLSLYVKPEKVNLKNIIERVTWRWTVRDETDYADLYKDTFFTSVDPNNFTEYQDLTDEIVFSWIDSVEDIEALKEQLDQNLVAKKTPEMVEKKIPWTKQEKYTGEEEYLIVFDDMPTDATKIWGPMRWSSERANNGLRERGVHDYEFPTDILMYQKELLPVDSPMIINDRVKLYRVEYTEQPILDDRFQYHEGLTWVVDSGKAVGTYFAIDRTVEEVKTILQTQLSNASFEKQIGGVNIELDGQTVRMNTDIVGRINLLQRWSLMGDTDEINHKINNDMWIELTKENAKLLLDKLHDHISSVLDWEKSVFDQIVSCETIENLKEIEI